MRATSFELIAVMLASGCGVFTQGPSLEQGLSSECNDGIDNDRDGLIDFPSDPGCESELDAREERVLMPRACSDGIDNDGDGRIDFDSNGNGVRDAEDDPGCSSAAD